MPSAGLRAHARQGEIEARSCPRLRTHPDSSAMSQDDALNDREPHSTAFELLRGVQALERTEEFPRLGHVEAGTVVAHVICDRAIDEFAADFDDGMRATSRELECV